MRHIEMRCKINEKVVEVPSSAIKGTICPSRSDYFQTECWRCDFCGRNEEYEHGAVFDTTEVAGFKFYIENITNCRIENDEFVFEYGNKTIFINIKYLPEFCNRSLSDIWAMIEELKNNGIVEDNIIYYDGVDMIKQLGNSTEFKIQDDIYGFPEKLTDEEAVICFITDTCPESNKLKTFIDLINYQNEETLTLGEWEDIYGYDI